MDKVKELEKIINTAKSYSDISNEDLIKGIYECTPIDKSRLLVLASEKVASMDKSYKKSFENMIKDYDNIMKIDSFNHICNTSIFGIPEEYIVVNELNTGEFTLNLMGISDRNGILICPTPILPLYLYRKNVDNVEKVRVLYRKEDKWSTLDIDRLTISSNNKIIDLANHGISVNSGNAANMVKYFNTIFDKNVENIVVRDSVAKLGWVDNNSHFIPYNSKNYDFVLSVNDKALDGTKQTYEAISEKGDYETWFECMQKMRTNIPTRLAFAASAVSPLLTILGSPCFVTMLYGKTGTGKTLSCRCAMSMWGDPNVLSMRADSTTASIVRKCLFFNNLPLFVDEFQLIKDNGSQEFLMSVTEGIQRTRATMDSSNNFTSSGIWKNCTLITGEHQCTTDHTIGGGAINRIIELRIDDMVADEMDLQDIYYKIDNNYGFLGEKLIELYCNDDFREKVRKRFKEIQDSWRDKLRTASKQLIAISCLALGDEILRDNFFHDEKEIGVEDVEQFVASMEDISYSERVYRDVCDLIIANKGKFIRNTAASGNNGAGSTEIWGWYNSDNPTIYYIIPKILKSELSRRDNTRLDNSTLEDWRHKGYIDCTCDKDGKLVKYVKRISIDNAKTYAYVFHTDLENEIKKEESDLE